MTLDVRTYVPSVTSYILYLLFVILTFFLHAIEHFFFSSFECPSFTHFLDFIFTFTFMFIFTFIFVFIYIFFYCLPLILLFLSFFYFTQDVSRFDIKDDDREYGIDVNRNKNNNSNNNNLNNNNDVGLSYNLMKKLTKLENEDNQVRKVSQYYLYFDFLFIMISIVRSVLFFHILSFPILLHFSTSNFSKLIFLSNFQSSILFFDFFYGRIVNFQLFLFLRINSLFF